MLPPLAHPRREGSGDAVIRVSKLRLRVVVLLPKPCSLSLRAAGGECSGVVAFCEVFGFEAPWRCAIARTMTYDRLVKAERPGA